MNAEQEQLYSALLDAVNRSKSFSQIPLPNCLSNPLDELNSKFHYDLLPEKDQPHFEASRQELSKKLKDKLKQLNKRKK